MSDTQKYSHAREIARVLGMNDFDAREHLYHALNRLGYFWKSSQQQWERYEIIGEAPPYEPIRIHLWANQERVDAIADEVTEQLASVGMYVVGRSDSIPSKPPEDFNSLVVLRFIAKQSGE